MSNISYSPIVKELPFCCPNCHVQLGTLINLSEKIYLKIGNWLVSSAKCHCYACGRQLFFSLPNKSFEDLAKEHVTRHYQLTQKEEPEKEHTEKNEQPT